MEEEEEATAAASPKDLVQVAAGMPSSPTNSTNSIPWVVGARLESKARDSNGGEQWFPAKVLEVEAEGRGVLVHYMQWNARHDEWIPSNSSRLRPATSSSGKSSRHNSGGSNDLEPIVPATMPAHKDFKSGEKVMATWKLNRKYLATVIKFEPLDGTYLVEFYDGVQCNVKPNNMRRPRKGEEDVDQQESLRINGAADNGSAENSDNEDSPATSGRRERKRKFDVKKLLNIRSVKSLRSNSKEDDSFMDDNSLNNSLPAASSSEKRKRRPERLNSQPKEPSPSSAPPPVINGGKTRTKSIGLEDGPALAAVSGKRERRKKKFWDDEVDPSTVITSSAVSVNSSSAKAKDLSSSALKRKSSTSVSNPIPKKSVKKSEKVANNVNEEEQKSNGQAAEDHHDSSPPTVTSSNNDAVSSKDKPSGKENGKVLPYLQLDLSTSAELIAEKMIEGVNIPGMGQPIPVDSSSLPEGWEKRVIQRRIGITKGKWDVFITNPETGKSFRSKTELQKHLDERKLPYTSDAFDFSLDDNLKKLRQIWKQYKVKPFLNNPKGPTNTNFKHVPAKITQVQDGDVTPTRGNGGGSKNSTSVSSVAVANALNSAAVNSKSGGPSSATTNSAAVQPSASSTANSENDLIDLACLAEIAVESETGQGLRCSIAKCGKLFRNDRLLRQHVKHYHPKVYEGLLCKHPQIGDDISEPTSPDNRRLSDSSDFFHDAAASGSERRRIPSSENCTDHFEFAKMKKGRSIKKSSVLDEEAPLSSIYEAENDEDSVFSTTKRSRNDSVLSSITSDTEELSVGEHHMMQQQRHSCPPTPPTFRLSKRRQAQMRKRIQQPVVRVSKIEDTPLGREYRDELLSMASTSSAAVFASSNTTSPTNVNVLDNTLTVSSYPPSEMDASIAGSEHLTSEELVNCTCRRVEEDGLMIQCDICLCWQHGYCIGLEDEDPVPEKHVCETCRQPTGGRTEARFSLDQDWLKEGKLPSCEAMLGSGFVKNKSSSAIMDRETAFRKLSELMADLANLDKVLHGLRVKLHVASQPSNSKVFMWSSVWSVPTHQPMTVEDEEDSEPPAPLPPDENNEAINRTAAIDPHIVAERLSLLANNEATEDDKAEQETKVDEEPVVNGIKDSSSPPVDNLPPEETKNDQDSSAKQEESSKSTEVTSQPQLETADSSNANEEQLEKTEVSEETKSQEKPAEASEPLTNGNTDNSEPLGNEDEVKEDDDESAVISTVKKMVSQNGTAEASEEHFDASFIPSVSEVERLLPSVIQEIASSKNNSSTTSPSTSKPDEPTASNSVNFVPEPKRLDRDECRLNLLQHIESVQAEIEKRYNAIESALAKIEAMPGASNAGISLKQANDSDAKLKAKLNKLIQDLAVARHLVWTL